MVGRSSSDGAADRQLSAVLYWLEVYGGWKKWPIQGGVPTSKLDTTLHQIARIFCHTLRSSCFTRSR
eukprot:scaffold3108_cov102-Skeletonema_dohrnii-CCMP3373.AAC.9